MKTITTATRTAPYTIKCAAATLALALLAACTPHATDEPATAHPVALMPTATIVSHGTATRADATPTDKVDIALTIGTLKLTMDNDAKDYTVGAYGVLTATTTPHKATVGKHTFSVDEAKVVATIAPPADITNTGGNPLPMNLNVAMQPAKNIDVPPSGTVDLPLTPTTAGMRLVLNMDAGVKPTSVTCVPSNEKATVGGVDPYNASSIVLLYNNTSTGVNTHAVAFGMLPAGTDIKAGVPLAAITTETGSTAKNLALYPPTNLTLNAGDMVTYTVHVGHSVASITDVKIGGFQEGNGVGGEDIGVGDTRLSIADGTDPEQTKLLNAKNPMWVIKGDGADVIPNVKAALDALTTGDGESSPTSTARIEVILQDFTRIIGAGADDEGFYGCIALASIKAPKATGIDSYAFSGCKALTTVSLPAATSIGKEAFSGCKALTAVSLPAATGIDSYAFLDCTALATVSLPAAKTIGEQAFKGCKALTAVSLPAAETIGGGAFRGCTKLETVILPAATSIGFYTFNGCDKLTTVSLPAATSIGDYAFKGCTALKTISLPAATTIEGNAFDDCTALTTVSLPVAKTIGSSVFDDCIALTTISLPAAETIKSNAFYGCKALETVILPAATSIEEFTFSGCDKLTHLELTQSTKTMAVSSSAFGVTTGITLVLNSKATNAAIGVTVDPSNTNKVTFKTTSGGTDGSPVTFKAVTYLNN